MVKRSKNPLINFKKEIQQQLYNLIRYQIDSYSDYMKTRMRKKYEDPDYRAKVKAQQAEYRKTPKYKAINWNPKRAERKRTWRSERPEIEHAQQRAYRQSPKGKQSKRIRRQRRRERQHNVIRAYTQEEWNKKLLQTKGVCPNCHKFVGVDKLTLDHIIPISKIWSGFQYHISHVQPLCHACNSGKKDKVEISTV
ncbi:HNH endonuclease [Candidatus Woesearchaeota archaeon]|nr:HNH endonuclease [Candidatus Woesearchaeota archaeon]